MTEKERLQLRLQPETREKIERMAECRRLPQHERVRGKGGELLRGLPGIRR